MADFSDELRNLAIKLQMNTEDVLEYLNSLQAQAEGEETPMFGKTVMLKSKDFMKKEGTSPELNGLKNRVYENDKMPIDIENIITAILEQGINL